MDPAEYAKMPDDSLCASYGGDNAKAQDIVRAEIDKRRLIPADDWPPVQHGDVRYGMRRCSVLAALHQPDTSAGRGSVIEVWTFPNNRVVRFQNGTVSAISDFR